MEGDCKLERNTSNLRGHRGSESPVVIHRGCDLWCQQAFEREVSESGNRFLHLKASKPCGAMESVGSKWGCVSGGNRRGPRSYESIGNDEETAY